MSAKIIEAAHRFRKHDLPSEKYYRDLREIQRLMEEREKQKQDLLAQFYASLQRPGHIDYVNKGPLP